MDVLTRFLRENRKRKLKIHCLGDVMVDEYYSVSVNRISPEFPMPIMFSPDNKCVSRPGGVANVASQFKHFNADVTLHCVPDNTQLPIKRRYLDNGVQIVRHDIESSLYGLSYAQMEKVIEALLSCIHSMDPPDVAILSDYNKGFFTVTTQKFLEAYPNVCTIVDPKLGPLNQWKGCTIFKPNAKEAFELSGFSKWRDQAKFIQQELECRAVVITYGGEKVVGVDQDEFFCHVPTKTVNVESVVGAGDCFCAFFAMAIGHGFVVSEAAEIAWNAGAQYVQGRMNRPVTPAELSPNGIVEPEDLRDRDFKLVFTNGCFDLLHDGHIKTLEFAKEKGQKLVVALNTDASIRRLKGEGRPVMPLEQRMRVMASLKPVDFVVSFDEDTPLEVIKKIRPDVLVKGQDYQLENIVGADIVPEVCRAPIIPGLSSSNFIQRQ